MAKFRQNHQRNAKTSSSLIIRGIAFIGLMLGILYFLVNKFDFGTTLRNGDAPIKSEVILYGDEGQANYLPTGGQGIVITHDSHILSYVEAYEQSEWVAYELTKAQLQKPNLPRSKWFGEDQKVPTRSAKHSDYSHSGYTRGHLIPSADRSYDKRLMDQTFLMSNISPQKAKFNGGIWNELEGQVRNWGYKFGHIIVVTGPILNENINEYIGKNGVAVPHYFYKVVLDIQSPTPKAIAFILPNEKSDKPIMDYMVSVDEVEEQTGLNFFDGFLEPSLEEKVESISEASKWPIDENLYKRRINNWNR